MLVLLALLASGPECQRITSLGREAYERRDYPEAARLFGAAARECGVSDDLQLAQAQAQMLSQQLEESLRALDQVLARSPRNVQALKVRAKALYLGRRDHDAEDALQTAERLASMDDEIPYDLGRMYYHQGRHADAAAAFRRSLAINPRAYKAWDNLGLATEALGDAEQALRHYLKAIELVHEDQPRYGVVYANVADLMLKRGEYERAFDLAAEAAERDANEARHFSLAGKALIKLQRYETSLRWLERATTLDSDYADAHYLLAQAYRGLGRKSDAERALAAFERATARAPSQRR